MKNNPYVGPQPYERQDRHSFFRRAREARGPLALVKAERAVLFYAQSGAGKTPLLNAQIIPALEEEGFRVLREVVQTSEVPQDLEGLGRPPILFLDQFEEILTTHRDRWRDAQEFFSQLQGALREMPTIGVVLSI